MDAERSRAFLKTRKVSPLSTSRRTRKAQLIPSQLRECGMKDISPKEKSGGATNATRSLLHSTEIVTSDGYSVNHLLAQWEKESQRLWAEYERTGNSAHLRALNIHRAAIRGRATEVQQ